MTHQLIKLLLICLAIIFLAWLFVWIFKSKKSGNKKYPLYKEFLFAIFLVYLAWVLCLTLLPVTPVSSKTPVYRQLNLLPFVNSIKQYRAGLNSNLTYLKIQFLQNLFGNILLFIPFGFLMPLFSPYKTFNRIFIFALLFSAGIEILQFAVQYFGSFRSVDIDDVLLNLTGASLGFLFYKILARHRHSKLSGE